MLPSLNLDSAKTRRVKGIKISSHASFFNMLMEETFKLHDFKAFYLCYIFICLLLSNVLR